jgi:hypothetical protein
MLYAARFAAWSPGIDTGAAWREWAAGKGRLVSSDESPAVPFLDAGLRRRLSQISKMTLKVLHGLLPLREGARLAFVSLRGEIQQQFSMNRKLALEGEVSPAAFSHSVFNNPVAMAALAFSLDAGYTAMYPSLANFGAAFVAAAASLCSGEQDEIAFIYADEHCPPPYPVPDHPYTLAFGMVLHTSGGGVPVLADAAAHNPGGCLHSPAALLRHLYQFPAETGEPA